MMHVWMDTYLHSGVDGSHQVLRKQLVNLPFPWKFISCFMNFIAKAMLFITLHVRTLRKSVVSINTYKTSHFTDSRSGCFQAPSWPFTGWISQSLSSVQHIIVAGIRQAENNLELYTGTCSKNVIWRPKDLFPPNLY